MALSLHLIILTLTLSAIILSLGVVWQSEKGLDRCFRLLTLALLSFAASEILEIALIFDWNEMIPFRDILLVIFSIIIVLSLLQMTKTIRLIRRKK